jgi:hypothetical protein
MVSEIGRFVYKDSISKLVMKQVPKEEEFRQLIKSKVSDKVYSFLVRGSKIGTKNLARL